MNLAEAIKKCSMEAWDASVPCDVMFGEVKGTEPVKIALGETVIPEEILYVPEHLLYREKEISIGIYDRVIVINEGLCVGDSVVLIRKCGGSGYVAIGKI